MSQPHAHAVWDAEDRDTAIAAAVEAHGENGSKMLNGGMGPGLGGFDHDVFAYPTWMRAAMTGFAQMFTHGLQGYADDRIADWSGWIDFDVTQIVCPVCVLHGTDDKMVDVIHPARRGVWLNNGIPMVRSHGAIIGKFLLCRSTHICVGPETTVSQ
jgi:pimeloyl-ACP methyl ester carboxylesterase